MTDQISTLYLDSDMLNRLCGKKESYQTKNKFIQEHKNGASVTYTVVSDILTLFPHLTLDEKYEMICYSYRHYHGINGQVVAVPKTVSFIPDIQSPGGFNGFWGPNYSIPESAIPPMEAIYTDSTYEGYFEAIMAENTLPNMMLNGMQCTRSHNFITKPPESFPQDWKVFVELLDWHPCIIHNHTKDTWSLSIVCKEATILNEDTIKPLISEKLSLRQYTFKKNLDLDDALIEKKRFSPVSKNHLLDNSRYTEYRRCSIPKEQFILLASKTSPYLL